MLCCVIQTSSFVSGGLPKSAQSKTKRAPKIGAHANVKTGAGRCRYDQPIGERRRLAESEIKCEADRQPYECHFRQQGQLLLDRDSRFCLGEVESDTAVPASSSMVHDRFE